MDWMADSGRATPCRAACSKSPATFRSRQPVRSPWSTTSPVLARVCLHRLVEGSTSTVPDQFLISSAKTPRSVTTTTSISPRRSRSRLAVVAGVSTHANSSGALLAPESSVSMQIKQSEYLQTSDMWVRSKAGTHLAAQDVPGHGYPADCLSPASKVVLLQQQILVLVQRLQDSEEQQQGLPRPGAQLHGPSRDTSHSLTRCASFTASQKYQPGLEALAVELGKILGCLAECPKSRQARKRISGKTLLLFPRHTKPRNIVPPAAYRPKPHHTRPGMLLGCVVRVV